MLGRMLRENRKAYTLIFVLDHAVQNLQDWVLHGSGLSFDKELYDQLRQCASNDRRTDEEGYNIELLGTYDRKSHLWLLNHLLSFVNHCKGKKNNRDSGDSKGSKAGKQARGPEGEFSCFRNNRKLANKLSRTLDSIIEHRNCVMHGRPFQGSMEELVRQCDQVLRQLRLYVGPWIEEEDSLQLLTMTHGELCHMAEIPGSSAQNETEEPSHIEFGDQAIHLIKTWYPGYGDSHSCNREWPSLDIPKYVTAMPLNWRSVSIYGQVKLEELTQDFDHPVQPYDNVRIEDLERAESCLPEAVLGSIGQSLPEKKVSWSAYEPVASKEKLIGRHKWRRNRDGYAFISIWDDHH
ncbi:MAG: hypothetical protein LLG06_04525 [Desulfobacteraceae bacterium]|nr:hypothetical protein [Desulfobacteraceae bacterium]